MTESRLVPSEVVSEVASEEEDISSLEEEELSEEGIELETGWMVIVQPVRKSGSKAVKAKKGFLFFFPITGRF